MTKKDLLLKHILKNKTLYLLILGIVSVIPVKAFAEEYTTGNSNASSSVTTNVSGGDVHTNIRVEANGEVKEVESFEEGEINVEVHSDTSNPTHTPTPTVDEDEDPTPTKKVTPTPKPKESKDEKFLEKFFEGISDFFRNLFN